MDATDLVVRRAWGVAGDAVVARDREVEDLVELAGGDRRALLRAHARFACFARHPSGGQQAQRALELLTEALRRVPTARSLVTTRS